MSAEHMISEGLSKRKAAGLAGISRHPFYYHEKERNIAVDEEMAETVKAACIERPFYGYRRITALLRRRLGTPINRKKVLRIMRLNDWTKEPPKIRPHLTIGLTTQIAELPNTRWQGDMTKIWCGSDGWGYLFTTIYCCDRGWLGKTFSKFCRTGEALECLRECLLNRAPETMRIPGLEYHTDGGGQFTSKRFELALRAAGFIHTVSRKNTPEDDAVVEALHKTLKSEYIWPYEFESFQQAEEVIEKAFHDYNECRLHSGINYQTPKEYFEAVCKKLINLEAKVVTK